MKGGADGLIRGCDGLICGVVWQVVGPGKARRGKYFSRIVAVMKMPGGA